MKLRNRIFDYLIIMGAAALLALSYHIFIFPNEFAPAGIPGIATIVQHLFDFKVGYMTIIVNIPLVIIVYLLVDHAYAMRSAAFAVTMSLVLLLLDYVDLSQFVYHTSNGTSTILAPAAGGVVSGCCYGVVMRRNSSTGGTDLVAAIQKAAMPDVNAGIVERYYASAIQMPALVIGQLSSRSNHHLEKIENKKLADCFRTELQSVATVLGSDIPATLNLEQQSYFALGYYQMGAKLNREKAERIAAAKQKKDTEN